MKKNNNTKRKIKKTYKKIILKNESDRMKWNENKIGGFISISTVVLVFLFI